MDARERILEVDWPSFTKTGRRAFASMLRIRARRGERVAMERRRALFELRWALRTHGIRAALLAGPPLWEFLLIRGSLGSGRFASERVAMQDRKLRTDPFGFARAAIERLGNPSTHSARPIDGGGG